MVSGTPGVVMDVWFAGQAEPRRYAFKTEDFKRFEIANREWMNSNRPGAEFGLEQDGKMVFIRIDQIVRREIISVTEASERGIPRSTYGLVQ